MHLFQKHLKYAFAYARMQMHNYPKPSDHITRLLLNLRIGLLDTHSESTPTIFPSFVSTTFPGTEIPNTFPNSRRRQEKIVYIFVPL